MDGLGDGTGLIVCKDSISLSLSGGNPWAGTYTQHLVLDLPDGMANFEQIKTLPDWENLDPWK